MWLIWWILIYQVFSYQVGYRSSRSVIVWIDRSFLVVSQWQSMVWYERRKEILVKRKSNVKIWGSTEAELPIELYTSPACHVQVQCLTPAAWARCVFCVDQIQPSPRGCVFLRWRDPTLVTWALPPLYQWSSGKNNPRPLSRMRNCSPSISNFTLRGLVVVRQNRYGTHSHKNILHHVKFPMKIEFDMLRWAKQVSQQVMPPSTPIKNVSILNLIRFLTEEHPKVLEGASNV